MTDVSRRGFLAAVAGVAAAGMVPKTEHVVRLPARAMSSWTLPDPASLSLRWPDAEEWAARQREYNREWSAIVERIAAVPRA